MRATTLRGLFGFGVGCAGFFSSSAPWAQENPTTERHVQGSPGKSALPLENGQLDAGLFSAARYGVTERIEIGAHPIGMLVLPTAFATLNWWGKTEGSERRGLWFSSYHRLSVPTPFLNLIAREGSLGLLPADTDVPLIAQLETLAIATQIVARHRLSVRLGAGVASSSELPLLEFPFLYSSLAPVTSPFTVRGGLGWEGPLFASFVGIFDYRASLFRPEKRIAWPGGRAPFVLAQEVTARVGWDVSSSHRVSFGGVLAHARYPTGYRAHVAPSLDYRINLF